MIYLEQAQTVDVQRENPILLRDTPLEKGDKRALRWVITVMAGREPADLAGMTAQLYIARRGEQEAGTTVLDPDAAHIAGNVITAILPEDAAAIPGQVVCLIRLGDGQRAITVARMGFLCADTAGNHVTLPAGGGITFEQALGLIKAAEDAAGKANAAAARAESAVSGADNAAKAASAAAGAADAAASKAGEASTKAEKAAQSIDMMTVTAENVGANDAAGAEISDMNGHKNIHFRLRQGLSYTILGDAYATLDALQAGVPHPSIGDQYNVGSSPPYTIYRWTGTRWEDQGKIEARIESMTSNEVDAICR